jgi:hypothetical protein
MHKAFSLTIGEDLWCYRAHCMQAHDAKFSVSFRSAKSALEGVVVLLPLPLLLASSVRDACLTR